MKYPEYSDPLELKPPMSGAIEVFGTWQGMNRDPQHWSHIIGSASTYLATGRSKQGLALLKEVRGAAGAHIPGRYRAIADMMQFRNNPNELLERQMRIHGTAINALKNDLTTYKREDKNPHSRLSFDDIKGKITESTALALLSRYAHPAVLAMPALPHMDQGETRSGRNFDICLAVNDGGSIQGHMLQVKASCVGRCGGEGVRFVADELELPEYEPSIQFVSGHCDLGIKDEDGRFSTVIPDLLLQEACGQLSNEGLKTLDILTDNLLFNVTADLMPRGTAPVDRTPARQAV